MTSLAYQIILLMTALIFWIVGIYIAYLGHPFHAVAVLVMSALLVGVAIGLEKADDS